ncbi:MAG TPA: hypothetical protein VK619_08800 [Pyrinomonadaceae bacterium]|nr:hypothetical protein [Pyrinomonadaceae bacterium]
MKKRKSDSEDDLRPHYDLDKLEVVAYGPGWSRRRMLRKKGRARALNPKRLTAIPNPALTPTADRKA